MEDHQFKHVSEGLEEVLEHIRFIQNNYPHMGYHVSRINGASESFEVLNSLRYLYRAVDTSRLDPHPYGVEWTNLFTPIERMVWNDIRDEGVPLWPQYPAMQYVLDFADPNLKIAVEADGAEFHVRSKDLQRDENLAEDGWRVFRVWGSECNRTINLELETLWDESLDDPPFWLMERLRMWQRTTSEGLIAAINAVYYGRQAWHMPYDQALYVLQSHCLLPLSVEGEAA